MRLAILLHAASSPGAREDARALAACLRAPDAGFEVVDLPAYEDAPTALPRLLQRVRVGSVVVVAVLAGLMIDSFGIGIEGGARALSLAEIGAALSATGADALLLVDGVVTGKEDPSSLLETVARSLGGQRAGLAALVSLRPLPSDARGLTRVLVDALGEPPLLGTVVQLSALVAALRQRDDLATSVPFWWLSPGPRDPLLSAPAVPRESARDEASPEDDRRALWSGDSTADARAGALVRMAAAHLARGDALEAGFELEKALALDHDHRAALEATLLLAVRARRWEDVTSLGKRLLDVVGDRAERFATLLDLARIWQDEARDDARAASALEEARALSPRTAEVHERLIAIYDRARRFADLTTVLEAYAALAKSPRERASRLSAAALIAGSALADRPRALALYDEALTLCPGDETLRRARRELAESALSGAARDDD